MKDLKKYRLTRDQLKLIKGSVLRIDDYSTCIAECGANNPPAVCQGSNCSATDGVGCKSDSGEVKCTTNNQ